MYEFLICAIAGVGAGVATGFAGMSAAVYILPILVTFLKVPAYEAIGIALASDVLASGISSLTYYRHGNIDIKRCIPLLATVLSFTVIGSIVGYFFCVTNVGNTILSYWSVVTSLFLGIQFLVRPTEKKQGSEDRANKNRKIISILFGIYTGFICGFQGTGGGMLLLLNLTLVLGYGLKTAVGTSVFIMTFTALIGAVSHFSINGSPDVFRLVVCVLFTLVAAQISAVVANRIQEKTSNRVIGTLLTVSGVIMVWVNFL